MKFKQTYNRFGEFGGHRLILQYAKMGLLWQAVKALACGLMRRSVKVGYAHFVSMVDRILVAQYGHMMYDMTRRKRDGYKKAGNGKTCVPQIVWTCWLQGMEQAPALVRQCVASQKACISDCKHYVLTLDNYREWVSLPEEVERKYMCGLMPAALFSDLLRLAVLLKYGGVWMDATVLCTGKGNERLQKRWQKVMKSPMTMFRYFNPQTKQAIGVSNWFIATMPGNVALEAVYEMLLAYWHDYDCTVDYYIMHLFLEMSQQYFPELWGDMPRMSSRNALLLGSVLGHIYMEKYWNELTEHVALHKLNYRKADAALKHRGSYCEKLLAMNFQSDGGGETAAPSSCY